MSVKVKYKGNEILSINTDTSKKLKTSGKYCEGDIEITNTQDGGITPSGNKALTATTSTQTGIDVTNFATVSVAPTPSETKTATTNGDVTPSSGKLLSKVTVNVPQGAANCKKWTVTFASDVTANTIVVTGDADVAAHYADATAEAMYSRREDSPSTVAGRRFAISTNKNFYTSNNYKGVVIHASGAAAAQEKLSSGNTSVSCPIGAKSNGDIYLTAASTSDTRWVAAGTYDILFWW